MGKKKRQKTKELSVAIAEASSSKGEQQETQQPQPPRKRGRPRKVVVETVSKQKKVEPIEESAPSTATQGTESLTKKQGQEGSSPASACTRVTKEEQVFQKIQVPKGEPSRSRARRKSKPRKST
ncbi:uncharacterized protein LOC113866360 [Abrus precatorius]|uniref:Uncharacterized protein LOC113866360 n=1 Tax=Abrus precatorius TaxID=3816 RepID=A0A8B8LM79_ABRPR|nr:uncharacterized protein LOC113866360 [Abrus precatorius]